MKVLFATTNPAKIKRYANKLKEKNIEVLTIKDLGINIKPEETGKDAIENAYIKAKAVFNETTGDRIVIGSDTMVARNNKIYGKPKNKENGIEMINELLEGDRTHEVITGLCVLIQDGEKYKEFKIHDIVKVILRNMTYNEIENWIDTGKATDKAGGYAIQEEFCVYVEKIEGNHTTIISLPMHKLYEIIKDYIR